MHWVIARLPRKPPSQWTKGQSFTNIRIGPLKWGIVLNFGRILKSTNRTRGPVDQGYHKAFESLIFLPTTFLSVLIFTYFEAYNPSSLKKVDAHPPAHSTDALKCLILHT